MKLKKLCTFLFTLQIAALCFSSIAFGATYKDIPSTHWAYTSIESLCAKGYLKDFRSENFNPDSYIDKFTASKILAAVAGYTDGDYSAQKNIISKFSSKFSKWNIDSNEQIAFLLSKNILLEEDLESFMLFSDNGSEKFRAISREETAVFLVRLMGKTTEAEALKNSVLFNDNSSITDSRRGSINYLKSVNVLNGSDGLCSPKKAVTKAEFCVLLNNPTELIKKASETNTQSNTNNITTVSGVITDYYKTLNILRIKTNNEINTYRLSTDVKIKLENETCSQDLVAVGLNAEAVIKNSEIIELSMTKEAPTKTEETSTEQTTASQDTSSTSQSLCMDSSAEGTIQSIKISPSIKNECILEILSDKGEIKQFSATRYTVPIYSLKIGDAVSLSAKDGQILSIKLINKNKQNIAVGYVTEIDEEEITIETVTGEELDFYYDENLTECFDCTTGKKIDFNDIKKYTEVYIFCEDTNSRTIDVIFVLDNL